MRTPLTICYLRQSLDTRKQANSVAVQLDAARNYHRAFAAKLPPWSSEHEQTFVDIATDSAIALADRKAGRELLRFAIPGDCIIFANLDRLGRTVFEMVSTIQMLKKRGLKLHILDAAGQPMDLDSLMGEFMVCVLAYAAALEKKRISERTRAAVEYRKTLGIMPGLPPAGKCRDENGQTIDHPGEQRQIAEARGLSLRGWSYKQIAAEFRRKGYLTRHGKPWTETRVWRGVTGLGRKGKKTG